MSDNPEEPLPPPPQLEETDRDAVVGMLVRVMRIDQANDEDKAAIDKLQAALAERKALRPKLISAFSAFGFETDNRIWKHVKSAIGQEAYSAAWQAAVAAHARDLKKKKVAVPRGDAGAPLDENSDMAVGPMPTVADAILAYLRTSEGRGVEVSELKKHLVDAYKMETHEKTPGMTLYRLSKEGLVRREARKWFATELRKRTKPAETGTSARPSLNNSGAQERE